MLSRAETLIEALMRDHDMTRDEAVTTVVTQDSQRRDSGRAPLVAGQPLSEVYKAEMEDGHLTVEQSAKVVAHLFDIPYAAALADLQERIAKGIIPLETKH